VKHRHSKEIKTDSDGIREIDRYVQLSYKKKLLNCLDGIRETPKVSDFSQLLIIMELRKQSHCDNSLWNTQTT